MRKLSIVIPVYNVEKYLPKCLDSLLDDTVRDYEIILINDGSTDGSLRVAQGYRDRFPDLITVISTENLGQGNARNVGIERAGGEFLYFIDSDDYLAEGGLRGIVSALDETLDILIFDSTTVNVDGKSIERIPGCGGSNGALGLTDYPELLLQYPDIGNKVFRRSLFTDSGVRFPIRVWYEDMRTIRKLYHFTDRIRYIPRAWHFYLQRPDSVTNTSRVRRNLEIIPAVDDLWGFYRSHGRWEELQEVLVYLAFHNEFLTGSVRVNLADWKSDVQETLLRDFLQRAPDWQNNRYVRALPFKHRLLTWLLMRRMRLSVHILMKLNNLIKDKKV